MLNLLSVSLVAKQHAGKTGAKIECACTLVCSMSFTCIHESLTLHRFDSLRSRLYLGLVPLVAAASINVYEPKGKEGGFSKERKKEKKIFTGRRQNGSL